MATMAENKEDTTKFYGASIVHDSLKNMHPPSSGSTTRVYQGAGYAQSFPIAIQ